MEKDKIYIDHIDFLRAIAVILVVLFHLDISLISGGFLGVDVFFVISGFLITRNINLEIKNTNKVDFKKFYIRRIRRLIPSLFLMLFLTFALGFLLFPPSLFSGLVDSMFFSSFALSNFYFLSETNYFEFTSNLKPLLHTWSLGVEEQFYLIYPITLLLIFKLFKNTKHVFYSLLGLLIVSLIFNYVSTNGFISEKFISFFISDTNYKANVVSLQFFLLPFRVFEFLLGAILVFCSKEKFQNNIVNTSLNILGLLLILFSVLFFNSQTEYMSALNFVPCLGASLFVFFTPNKFVSSIYNASFFKLTGKISYTLYLFHWPIIVFYGFVFGFQMDLFEKIFLIGLTYIVSYFIYEFYETPLRNYNPKSLVISNHGLISLIIVSLIVISNIKISVTNDDGWMWRVDDKKIESLAEFKDPVDFFNRCYGGNGYPFFDFLNKNEINNNIPDMIWMGDSHAGHYCFGLDSVMVKKNRKNIFMSRKLSTLHLPDIKKWDIDYTVATEHLKKLKELIINNPGKPVVISHFWHGQMSNSKIRNDITGEFEDFTFDATGYRKLCEKIIKFTSGLGQRDIIIMGESPYKEDDDFSFIENYLVPKYILTEGNVSSTFTSVDKAFEINAFFETYFSNFSNIHFINPCDYICYEKKCVEQENGIIYFSDKNHFSKQGSVKLIESMEQELLSYIKGNNSKSNVIKNSELVSNFIVANEFVDFESPKLTFFSWSHAENMHRWSLENESKISFELNNVKNIKGVLSLNFSVHASQSISLFINDELINEQNYNAGYEQFKTFKFNPNILKEGKNEIKFTFSNPQKPGGGDDRNLAMAFIALRFN